LTPAQVQKYEPTLDKLRAAATARKKVTIYWDNVNHTVSTIIVRWDQYADDCWVAADSSARPARSRLRRGKGQGLCHSMAQANHLLPHNP